MRACLRPAGTAPSRAVELLEVPPELMPPALERLAQDDRIRPELIPLHNSKDGKENQAVSEARRMYGTPGDLFDAAVFGEKGVAERLKTLAGLRIHLWDNEPQPVSLRMDCPRNNRPP
jgi:hypothetical protein